MNTYTTVTWACEPYWSSSSLSSSPTTSHQHQRREEQLEKVSTRLLHTHTHKPHVLLNMSHIVPTYFLHSLSHLLSHTSYEFPILPPSFSSFFRTSYPILHEFLQKHSLQRKRLMMMRISCWKKVYSLKT